MQSAAISAGACILPTKQLTKQLRAPEGPAEHKQLKLYSVEKGQSEKRCKVLTIFNQYKNILCKNSQSHAAVKYVKDNHKAI